MSEEKEVLLKEVLQDREKGAKMDAWYESQGIKVYQCGEELVLKTLDGKDEGRFAVDELIEEYEFEKSNRAVPKKCVE